MDNRPIGMFDSGVGGLTVYKEIRKKFLNENIVVNIFYKDKIHQANLIASIIKMISEKRFIKQYQAYPQQIKFIQQKDMMLLDENAGV